MSLVLVHDATGAQENHLPAGFVAGYSTGKGAVPWTAEQFAAHPGAVRIDQDPAATDSHADALDMEYGAATLNDCGPWVNAHQVSVRGRKRIGQRMLPVIYVSKSSVTSVVNALIKDGIKSGVGLWIASWTDNETVGESMATDTGPFPIIGCQFASGNYYDSSVMESSWLSSVVTDSSVSHYSVSRNPPGQWEGMAVLSGTGTDGNKWHTSTSDGKSWSTPQRS